MDVSKYTRIARRALKLRRVGAVIVAAGSASRMKGIDKVMAPLKGEPLIVHSVRAFQECDAISEIVIVTRSDLIGSISALTRQMDKVRAVVSGGSSRAESVNFGLNALSSQVELAAIHDGARPLVTAALIDRVARAANSYGGAIPVIPVKDTIKIVDGAFVDTTPARASLRGAQTPQIFDFDLLRAAMKKVEQENLEVTDDCSAVEALGFRVKTVEGEERNLKVTTPFDLKLAQLWMEETQ